MPDNVTAGAPCPGCGHPIPEHDPTVGCTELIGDRFCPCPPESTARHERPVPSQTTTAGLQATPEPDQVFSDQEE